MGKAADEGSRDLYAVLEISATASQEEIRAAFRRIAAECHPDRNPGDVKATLRFKRVNAAYQVLGDAVKRAQYDALTAPIVEDTAPPPPRAVPAPAPRPSRQAPARAAPDEEPGTFVRCPSCDASVASWRMRCDECGRSFAHSAKRAAHVQPPTSKQGSTWSRVFGAIIALVMAKFVFAGAFRECSARSSSDQSHAAVSPPISVPVADPAPVAMPPAGYVVQPGDGWFAIASASGVDLSELLALNGATPSTVIHPGDVLRLPGSASRNAKPPPTNLPAQAAYGTSGRRISGGHWSFVVPSDWSDVTSDPAALVAVVAPRKVGGFLPNVSLGADTFDGSTARYAQETMRVLPSSMVVDSSGWANDSLPASMRIDSHGASGATQFRTIQYLVAAGGRGYVLTCTVGETGFASVRPTCESILASLHVW